MQQPFHAFSAGALSYEGLFGYSAEEWLFRRKGFRRNPKIIQRSESLFTIGNGYLNIRGSLEELPSGHAGGMYLNGIYDRSEADVEELVKCPMWTDVSVWSEGEKFCPSTCRVLFHEQVLDLKKGILHRSTTMRNGSGRILTIESLRLVCMHNPHLGYLLFRIVPRNFSGFVRVFSGLNGEVTNRGFFPEEQLKHLQLEKIERGRNFMYLETKTRQRGIRIAEAASWKLVLPESFPVRPEPRIYGEKFTSEMTLEVSSGCAYTFEKLAVVLTSREVPEGNMFRKSICELKSYVRTGAAAHIASHIDAWEERWRQADIRIEGDPEAQQALRYNIYHLLINAPPTSGSIGAKFLSSEGYLGHVFWDTEIFILPFYVYNFPAVARNMLIYRYDTLSGALKNAEKQGYRGAKYAWESATTGEDVTPRFASKLERTIRLIYTGSEEDHIVSDVIYALEKYFRVTGDEEFLFSRGLEMVFQTARFWASRVVADRGIYEIRTVIGPDEFHEHVDNNAYTNYMVKWHLRLAVMLFRYMAKRHPGRLEHICTGIGLVPEEADTWLSVSRKLKFSVDPETLLVEQFDGYFRLRDYVIKGFDRKGHPVLPRGVTYRNIASTTLVKQADVLMMMHLFPHAFSDEVKRVNYDYYEKRTAHKSSLSHCTHAMMGLDVGKRSKAYHYFMKTAQFDLENLHGNTHMGIHAAAVGGSWQTVVYGFGGFSIKSDRLVLKPWLPKKWKRLSFSVRWQDRKVDLAILHDRISICINAPEEEEVPVSLYRKTYKLRSNREEVLRYCTS
ncbi:MAG: glycoside hydrolase family 65 protein [Chlorobi bacterium]|nr:glycoside hydrolase family 65 protein [Chlorobiota bacterium]